MFLFLCSYFLVLVTLSRKRHTKISTYREFECINVSIILKNLTKSTISNINKYF